MMHVKLRRVLQSLAPYKHMLAVSKFALIVSNAIWSNAYAESSLSEFSTSIQVINTAFLNYCRENSESVLDTRNVLGPLNETDTFRQACGQGIDDKQLPYTPYKAIYYRQFDDDTVFDFMGLQQNYAFDGKNYRLVTGQAFRINKTDPAAPSRQVTPEAYLFVEENERWVKAWQFASALSTEWHLPNAAFPEKQNISPEYSAFLYQVWADGIHRGIRKVARNIQDQRGSSVFSDPK